MKLPRKLLFLLSFILTWFFCWKNPSAERIARPSDLPVLSRYGVDHGAEHGLEGVKKGNPSVLQFSIAPPEQDTLVALPDGTVLFQDKKSSTINWSFSSGTQLHSSYQAFLAHGENDSEAVVGACPNLQKVAYGLDSGYDATSYPELFLDLGEDGILYKHSKLNGSWVRERAPFSIEEYVNTKQQEEFGEGVIVIKEKITSVFVIDAKTGRLDYTSPPVRNVNNKLALPNNSTMDQIFITRTDYILRSYYHGCLMWNLAIADFATPFSPETKVLVYSWPHRTRRVQQLPPGQEYTSLRLSDGNQRLETGVSSLTEGEDKLKIDKIDVPENIWSFLYKNGEFSKQEKAIMLKSDAASLASNGEGFEQDAIESPKTVVWFIVYTPFLMLLLFIPLVLYLVKIMGENKSKKQSNSSAKQFVPTKRRKTRKGTSGKIGANGTQHHKHIPSENEEVKMGEGNNVEQLPMSQRKGYDIGGGRLIGRIFVSNTEIAKGSNGTIVLEGVYNSREVAVKRLVLSHNDIAFKEIENLRLSDGHPNIVRWHEMEQDQDFVYIALERCSCNLGDFIQSCVDLHKSPTDGHGSDTLSQYLMQLKSSKKVVNDLQLWTMDGHPSCLLLSLMRDIVVGLAYLHDLGIIHRDLKPQNVLINTETRLSAKLSDMGISKRLSGDMSSLVHHATGYGTSGWQAPEQLKNGRQTRAMDLFSLGCVLFFCVTGGRHPFGDHLERDINIVKNRVDLFLVEHIPEAVDLFSKLLDPIPEQRPKAKEVLSHPFFWNSKTRLLFLRDASDRVELVKRDSGSDILNALEAAAPVVFGGSWGEKLDAKFIDELVQYRKYKFESVRDLLRVIRNKYSHHMHLDRDIQDILGPVPVGFDRYFSTRFPKLLIEVYKVICTHWKEEEHFRDYFSSG